MKKIRTLTIVFDNELKQGEISCFRGAIASSQKDDVLFHNHENDDKLRYSYPLIQYKAINNKATIVAIDKGVESVADVFQFTESEFSIGRRKVRLEVSKVLPQIVEMDCTEELQRYHISQWLPCNVENYLKYKSLKDAQAKIDFLENILVGNILSLGKGIDVMFEDKVVCTLLDFPTFSNVTYKNVTWMSVDVDFATNVLLPAHIGVGKGVSHGFGVITPLK